MANPNAPFGLRPSRQLSGANTGQINEYQLPATDATTSFIGDAVSLTTGSDATDGTPLIIKCTTSSRPVGVIQGFKPVLTNLSLQYHLASTLQKVEVLDDPNALFQIQSDGTLAAADVGEYAPISVSTAGSTFSGLSGMQLHEASVTGTPTTSLALMITRLFPQLSNALGANGIAEVLLITHLYRTATAV